MWVVTDRPDVTEVLLPEQWRGRDWDARADTDPAARATWQALAGAAQSWSRDVGTVGPAVAFWPHLVLLADAARSPFDVLHHELASRWTPSGPSRASPCRDEGSMASAAATGWRTRETSI